VGLTSRIENTFRPIADFRRTDADVIMIFIRSAVLYTAYIPDPVFNATRQISGPGVTGPKWASAVDIGVIGCTEEYQFCNGDNCTTTSGLHLFNEDSVQTLGYNGAQMATFKLLWTVLYTAKLRHLGHMLGADSLSAVEKLYTAILAGGQRLSSALSSHQWQIEVENMHNISMAVVQRSPLAHAAHTDLGGNSVETESYFIHETDPEGRHLCASQKIKTTAYTSFSVLGLALIISFGSVILFVNAILADVVGWIQKRTGRGMLRRQQWIESEVLQLQRMALEGRGIGPWRRSEDHVPITVQFGKMFKFEKSRPLPASAGYF